MRLTRTGGVAELAAVALLAVACSSSDGNGGDGRATRATRLAHASSASGPGKQAREVCSPMIRRAVEYEVGAPLEGEPAETVDGDTFTCTYRVAGGSIVMSVRDLKRVPAAEQEFAGQSTAAEAPGAVVNDLPGLGHGGFVRPDGTLVVRKDAMVLTIDMTGMADSVDGRDKSTIATNLGVAVMGCW